MTEKKTKAISFAAYEKGAASTVSEVEKWEQINRVLSPEAIGLLNRQVAMSKAIEGYKKAAFHAKNIETFPSSNETTFDGTIPYNVIHGVIGIAGEAGEVLELVLQAREDGRQVDLEELKNELGDVLWYLTLAANGAGFTLEEIARYNNEKLAKRALERDFKS